MSEDVWSQRDTTPDAIEAALRELLRERHAANQVLAPARVLNLVVVVDREWKGEISNRLQTVGRYHASRTILCTVEEGRRALDATALITWDEPQDGAGLGVMREQVVIDVGPAHLANLKTIVDPIIVSDLPTVLWCPHGHEAALRSLLGLVDVILCDSDQEPEPAGALVRSIDLLRSAYVVDLAWLRTTPWRERLAATFDPPFRRPELYRLKALSVRHNGSSTVSALLLTGWLASRLRWEPHALESRNGAGLRGSSSWGRGEVELELEPVSQNVPGLAGVTVASESGFSLALDREPGGLCARSHLPDGREDVWQILGASRGEGGILGEGVRQALLRDPTYGPALAAARTLYPG
jgi:glucose-6-phosphate dehydrogenase assembly protein OpcA